MISQERLKIEVKLLLSANRKSYMSRDLKWPFYASRAISAVAEVLVDACGSEIHTLFLSAFLFNWN